MAEDWYTCRRVRHLEEFDAATRLQLFLKCVVRSTEDLEAHSEGSVRMAGLAALYHARLARESFIAVLLVGGHHRQC